MWKNGFTCFLFAIHLLASFVASSTAIGYATINILVIDAYDGKPIEGAKVILYDGNKKLCQISDREGQCIFLAPASIWYNILVFSDDPSTHGRDYVPSVFSAYLEEDMTVTYIARLLPGATIEAVDEAFFLNISQSGSFFLFTIMNTTTGEALSVSNSLAFYGHGFPSLGNPPWKGKNWQSEVLGLGVREIVVPANTPVSIDVKTITWSSGWYGQEFIMDNDGSFYNLTKGELIQDSLSKYSLRENLVAAERSLNLINNSVSEIAAAGFYMNVASRYLTQASNIIEGANEFYLKADYSTSYSYLRKAYLLIKNVESYVKEVHDSVNLTTSIGPVLLAVIAMTLGFFFSEDASRRYIVSLIALSILLTFFYFMFPGCRITALVSMVVTSSLSLFSLLLIIPLLFYSKSEKKEFHVKQPPVRTLIWSIFSMAKRNLKRKRLRSSLSIINLSILVFAFIVLTSVSFESGLIFLSEPRKTVASDGILIRKFGSMESPELPLPPSLLDWLNKRPEVQTVVPKAENIPKLYPLGNLTSQNGAEIQIWGLLGIRPSLEKDIIEIQKTVVAGRFLNDNMTNAILLSERAADKLGANVGDHLFFNGFVLELVGIVDDEEIENCMDIDGHSILPQKLTTTFVGTTAIDCSAEEVIITTFSTVLLAPDTMISRVDVKLKENQDLLAFSELVVLSHGFDTWVSIGNSILHVKVGQALKSIGFESVIPLLIMVTLSVGLHFFGAVNERKNEISSMSPLGITPSHITIMVMSEAITMGFIGGGIGYLGALGSYKVLSCFQSDLMVTQKISIVWALIALFSRLEPRFLPLFFLL